MENDKFEYVTNAFHELKNPLTTIGIACDLIKRKSIDYIDCDIYLNVISNECSRMENIINNTINSLKNNYFDVDTNQNCDVHQILCTVIKNSGIDNIGIFLMAKRHGVKGNVEYLESAFREILDNAVKYKSELPLRMKISTFNVEDNIKITFSDNGIGIDKKDQNKIFDKGFKNETIENQRSTGLGLYYLRRNIQRINGAIMVESENGRGSLFTITLPLII